MWIALLKRSDWRLLRAATAVLSLIVLLLVWGFNFQRLATHKTQALEAAQTQQNNLAIIVADNFKQLLDSARFIARGIAQHGKLFSALIAADEKNRSLITRLEDEKNVLLGWRPVII